MNSFFTSLPLDCLHEIINYLDLEAKNSLIFVSNYLRRVIISNTQLPVYGDNLLLFALMQHTIGVDFFRDTIDTLNKTRKVRLSDFVPLNAEDPITKWFVTLNGGDTNRLIMMIYPEVMGLRTRYKLAAEIFGAELIKWAGKKEPKKVAKTRCPFELVFFTHLYIEAMELIKVKWMLDFGVQLRSELKIKMLLSNIRSYGFWNEILHICDDELYSNYTQEDCEYIGRYVNWDDYIALAIGSRIKYEKRDIIMSTARHYGNKSLLGSISAGSSW